MAPIMSQMSITAESHRECSSHPIFALFIFTKTNINRSHFMIGVVVATVWVGGLRTGGGNSVRRSLYS